MHCYEVSASDRSSVSDVLVLGRERKLRGKLQLRMYGAFRAMVKRSMWALSGVSLESLRKNWPGQPLSE